MQANPIEHASRQQVHEEVLGLIRSRSSGAAAAAAVAAAGVAAVEEKAAPPTGPVQTEAAVREINQALGLIATGLRFETDAESSKTVIKVVDRDSGEVLRQIPSEAAVQIARSLHRMVGHLVNQAI